MIDKAMTFKEDSEKVYIETDQGTQKVTGAHINRDTGEHAIIAGGTFHWCRQVDVNQYINILERRDAKL